MDSFGARATSLLRFRSLPGIGLLLWGCELLGWIHLGSFGAEVGSRMITWTQAHALVVVTLGFAWLGISVFWPNIKPLLSRLPKTMHEKIDAIYKEELPRLSNLESQVSTLREQTEAMLTSISSIGSVISEGTKLHGKMLDLRDEFYRLNAEKRIERIEITLGYVPSLCKYLLDITRLIWSVEQSLITFARIRDMYGSLSPVVTKPFSDWRLPSHSLDPPRDDSIRDGEKWARALEEYITRAQSFRASWHGDYFINKLFTLVAHWKVNHNDTSADEVTNLLVDHRAELLKMRSDYAAHFNDGTIVPSSTSS